MGAFYLNKVKEKTKAEKRRNEKYTTRFIYSFRHDLNV